MKKITISFISAFLMLHFLAAQTSVKDLEKHRKEVEESLQKGTVAWSLDTVFKGGVPYCMLTKDGKGLLYKGYSVYNLGGDELIYVKKEVYDDPKSTVKQLYYAFNFLESGDVAEIDGSIEKDQIARFIVKNNLIEDEIVNPTAMKKLVQVFGTKISERVNKMSASTPTQSNNPGDYYANKYAGIGAQKAATGNKYGNVVNAYIIGGKVKINTTEVGTVREEQKAEGGGIIKRKYFYDKGGNLVAEATCEGINCQEWEVKTPSDKNTDIVSTQMGQEAQKIAVWLAKMGYY